MTGNKEIDMPAAKTIEEKKAEALAKQSEVVRSNTDRTDGQVARRRNVFNGTEGKMSVDFDLPDYEVRIFNDTPGRIEQALSGGWEFVSPTEVRNVKTNVVSRNTDVGDKVRFLTNPSAKEGEQYGYLMKIRKEWWLEDQAALQAKNNAIDDSIRNGRNPKDGSSDGFYVPNEGIKYGYSNKF
jgi:hypothetical protein